MAPKADPSGDHQCRQHRAQLSHQRKPHQCAHVHLGPVHGELMAALECENHSSEERSEADDGERFHPDGVHLYENRPEVKGRPEKAKDGLADEIRPCVACNQGCTDMVFTGR